MTTGPQASGPSARVMAGATVAALLCVALFYANFWKDVHARRHILLERGETVLGALAAGIRAHGRMGRYSQERLTDIFTEAAAMPDVRGLALRAGQDRAMVLAGDLPELPLCPPGEARWTPDLLVLSTAPDLTHQPPGPPPDMPPPPIHGRGKSRRLPPDFDAWEPFPPGPLVLSVALDTRAMTAQIRGDWLEFAVACAVTVSAIFLGAWLLGARMRQRTLQSALGIAQERAGQAERLALLGAGLAHETKNPLGIVRGLAQNIVDAPGLDSVTRDAARAIVDEADRTVGRINSFLALSRPQEPRPEPVTLDVFAARLVELVAPDAVEKGVTVQCEIPPGLTILADEELLRRAMLNLLLNALRATPRDGRVVLRAARDGAPARLEVEDTGSGIAPEDLLHVREPYFTRFEGGTGLGLAIVDQIAQAHGWRLEIASDVGRGTVVTLSGLQLAGERHD